MAFLRHLLRLVLLAAVPGQHVHDHPGQVEPVDISVDIVDISVDIVDNSPASPVGEGDGHGHDGEDGHGEGHDAHHDAARLQRHAAAALPEQGHLWSHTESLQSQFYNLYHGQQICLDIMHE